MTDETDQAVVEAAVEAAQRVVEEVTSWEYSAEEGTIADKLDEGLRAAGVALDDDERTRILAEIDDMKDEHSAEPRVRSARPVA